jgi:hypothetical protein
VIPSRPATRVLCATSAMVVRTDMLIHLEFSRECLPDRFKTKPARVS